MKAEPVIVRRSRATGHRPGNRVLGISIAAAAALVTSACAAGQQAATANVRTTLEGINGDVGAIHVRGLLIEAPSGVQLSYPVGGDAEVKAVLVNVGNSTDRLVSITSPAVSDWGTFANTADAEAVLTANASATSTSTSPSASATPSPQPNRSVPIPAGGRVSWGTPESTGSLVIFGFSKPVYPGTTVSLTLRFANAGSLTLSVPVELGGSPNLSPIPEPSTSSIEG